MLSKGGRFRIKNNVAASFGPAKKEMQAQRRLSTLIRPTHTLSILKITTSGITNFGLKQKRPTPYLNPLYKISATLIVLYGAGGGNGAESHTKPNSVLA